MVATSKMSKPSSPTILLTALTLTITHSLSLASAASTQKTWAAVSFVHHGEKEPSSYSLTTTGAHQLYSAGSVLRDRYVEGNATELTQAYPINGLSSNAIDNSQLYLLSRNDEYVAASAQAFLQGLYPPTGANGQGSEVLANGSLQAFPVGGYQYPNIGTVGTLDFNSIWIAGNLGCTNYDIDQFLYLSSDHYAENFRESAAFYASLESSVFSAFDPSIVNYANAYQLYEYALYESIHNGSVARALSSNDLGTLNAYASEEQFALNSGNASQISTIAGSTLAAKVVEMFSHNIASNGVSDKMSVLFGSFEPFLSFFSLSGLADSYQSNSKFRNLPLHGSVMSFELFSFSESTELNLSTPYPPTDELYVRFLFRNGSSDGQQLLSYPLFGRGNSDSDMTWSDFTQAMSGFAMYDAVDWCTACNTINLFCQAVSNRTVSSPSLTSRRTGMQPWVAGIIGATATLAAALLAAALLAILAGARIAFHSPKRDSTRGGFKGPEKMRSDTDLAVSKGGAGASVIRHERVGSWELNDKKSHAGMDRVVSGAEYSRRSEEHERDLVGVDPFGDPVKALDQV